MDSHTARYTAPPPSDGAPVRSRMPGRPLKKRENQRVPTHVRAGLLLLLQAHDYALDVERDPWDFAVELTDLRRAGLSKADCRWLVCKSWVEVGRELAPADGKRRFRREAGLTLSVRACMILSIQGVKISRELRRQSPSGGEINSRSARSSRLTTPHWDCDRRELRVSGKLVKQFKAPSPNQELVLVALQEENWAPRIDDPLPPSKSLDTKQRLHDTIKNLNRHQKHRLIRFMGDGTGLGIRWELIHAAKELKEHRLDGSSSGTPA